MRAAANRRPRRNSVAVIIMCLFWVCLHGSVNLLAAAVPVPRRPSVAVAGSHVLGSRPIPAGGGAGGFSSPSVAARFGDDKRRIPSCPDALHNSSKACLASYTEDR
ncbi:hypothetical protein SETIT_5G088100v2 [Setaria italica]|uniref:Uncharacterized protein n=1 Tax=Setaria italica TaxID=4555 RepID=A0A368R4K4_SETIT|nr:hypothetical protein SETIT_5G088100v2 [Setaria italica]